MTTTYSYDALNRLIGKTYSDTTPTVSYFYDQASYNGLAITNGKGRRTGMSDSSGETAWSYDADGHVLTKRQTIAGITNSISYTYNLNGSVATITYPSGKVYTYGYSNAMRAVSVKDIADNIPYLQNAHYAAPGMLTSATQGTHNGFNVSNSFNNRLQPTLLSASSSSLTLMSMSYNWTLPNGKNNGSVYQIQNNRDTTRSLQYGYDQLNRLTSAKTYNATTWGDSYLYDNWGNLLQKNVTQGTAENLQVTVDAHNHVTSNAFTYDASGDLTWDTFNSMKYDAEGRATPTTGGSYLYDGDGHRVQMISGSSTYYYWYDDSFSILGTTGANVRDYVYFNGSRIAFLAGTLPYFYVNDNLGSASIIANGDGSAIEWESDYYPYGGQRVITNSITNFFSFTGYQYDSGTHYYYAEHRIQSPNLGRFMSPDPDAGNLANPQSLNRYAYVINNPTNGVDPDGRRMTSPLAELGAGGAAGLYLSTLASDPTGSVGSNWDEFGALQQALTPTVLAPTAVSSIISSDYNPTDEISTTFSPAVVIYPNAGMLSVLDSVDPGPRQIGISKIPNMPRRVNVAMLIAMAKRHFSATCNSDFGKVIPHYSKSKFFNSLSNAPVQQYPPGTNNIPSHDSGADADIGVDQPGLPIRLFPNFYGTDQSYQAFILVHEEVHRFTGWSDSQIFSNFAPFGLVPPESGYGTGGFTTWLQGGCKP